ncbi:hypothetical protein [Saccharothrix deserti]|uniref:hypothetical protein n=1 Tax=Saccharothrix deserti TaxID=2593674 RepID=UPI00192E75C8|nr:hypothetical protein [Saccharothrix deserti]
MSDLQGQTYEEGDSGTQTFQVPVTVSGDGPGSLRLFVNDANGTSTQRLVTVQPGQHKIEIPVQVTGNTRWSSRPRQTLVLVKAVQGTVAGRYVGGLTVLDDDPEPTVTVTPVADEVAEGGVLTWRVTLSAVADDGVVRLGGPVAVAGGSELSTTDVDAEWFRRQTFDGPLPARPLSASGLRMTIYVPPGQLSTEITIPTATDTETEPAEQVRLRFTPRVPDGSEITIVGTVTDAGVGG